MHRLLQGEVGSGKTVAAVATLLAGVEGGYQGAVMAPTEVLAEQHFLSITALLDLAGMAPDVEGEGSRLGMDSLFAGPPDQRSARPVVALLTGSSAEVTSRGRGGYAADLLDMIAAGDVDLVIGTHALIQEGVHFHRARCCRGRRAASLRRPSAGRPQGEGGRRRPRPSHHDRHPHPGHWR